MSSRGLTEISLPDLEALLQAIERSQLPVPVTSAGLQGAGLGHLRGSLGFLDELGEEGVAAALSAAIAERRHRPLPRVRLVWTGPEARTSTARETAVVVRQLFKEAQERVLVGGFRFDHGAEILRPLHAAMTERGVAARIFLDLGGEAQSDADVEAYAAAAVSRFFHDNWPFSGPRPEICYDPRTVRPGVHASLHAKCVVVDDRKALVTSANFTDRGQTRNIEAGVLVEDVDFAKELVRQWDGLLASGLACRYEV